MIIVEYTPQNPILIKKGPYISSGTPWAIGNIGLGFKG